MRRPSTPCSTATGRGTTKMSNSALICYTKLSPNHSGNRTHAIDTISIHCMAGNLSVESCGALFANSSRQASSNYGIGSDGRIALYVPEAYRSWCTSSRANDQRAITIEVANNGGAPDWPVSDKAYQALLNLVEDICQRNSIKKLVWSTVKNNRVNHVGGCNMTVHRDYAAKACPGDYLYDRHGSIAAEINKRLGGGSSTPSTPTTGSEQTATNYTVKVTATDLNIRSGPGTNYGRKGFIAPGVYTIVAEADGTGATKWGKLKSGVGWISLDYVTKTGTGATAAPAIKVGSKVTIDDGAVYGGLATTRGKAVPSGVSGPNRKYTVKQLATHKGEEEALLQEIVSWVALKYLNAV
nr:MAG TPA: N-acetylmuramoyl-L-alanine amidase [Caudoviricetes sp.]